MVRAKITAGKLNNALEAVTVLVESATVRFGPDGLKVQTVDPSHVGAVSVSLLDNAFAEYEGAKTKISIDIGRFARITNNIPDSQSVELRYTPDTHELFLDTGAYEFELSLLDPDSVQSGKQASDVEPPGSVVIDIDELQNAVKFGSMISEEIILGIDDKRDVFYINVTGDNDSMAVSFTEEDSSIEEIVSARAHSRFSMEMLAEMVRVIPSNTDVTIELGKEYPAKLRYRIANGNGRVAYGLAPRA